VDRRYARHRMTGIHPLCKYPPAEPVALRLLAPQRGLFATVRSKSKNKSKSLVLLSSLPQHRQFEENRLPEFSKFYCHPGRAGGSPLWISNAASKPQGGMRSAHSTRVMRILGAPIRRTLKRR
jgi:hypothetical protein